MSCDFNWSLVFRSTRPESVSFGLVRNFLAEVFFRLFLRELDQLGWVLVSGDIFQVRFCRLLSMDGSRIRSSRPDFFDVGLWTAQTRLREWCSLLSLRFNLLCF